MRKAVFYFVVSQIMDVLTTIIGLSTGVLVEGNPLLPKIGWMGLIWVKVFGIVAIALVLQFKKEHKLDMTVPLWAMMFPLWNAVMFASVTLGGLT